MTPRIPEEYSIRLIDCTPFVVMGNTMPPRARWRTTIDANAACRCDQAGDPHCKYSWRS